MTPVAVELLLGYHPCSTGFLTSGLYQVGGQCQVGSLTGAVASEKGSDALKGSRRMVGNPLKGGKGGGGLCARPGGGGGTREGARDPGG